MAEVQIPEDYPIREGYILDLKIIFLDLYRLLTIFGASKTLSQMADVYGGDPISELMEPEIDEIKRIIVTASVTARIVDERDGFIIPKDKFCGELIPDLSKPTDIIGLNLREACNKIIHANKFRTDLDRESDKPYMLPKLYFYGKKSKQEWKATLNVYEFVSIYHEILKNA
jgi:hypothetical protein